jgi:hypothetical protein
MTKATFGLFDRIDRAAAPLHQLYKGRLRLLEVADTASVMSAFFGGAATAN